MVKRIEKSRTAFSYVRMSTEAQLKGHSLQRQLDLARAYSKEKGFDLVEDLKDIGLSAYSGKNAKRGAALGDFLEALRSKEVPQNSVLLVESLDRLSRQNPLSAFNQFSMILDHGIEIHTLFDRQIYTQESVNTNPGQLFLSIGIMLRAHSESEEKSRRLKKKWQFKRDNLEAKILTARCPAWLRPNSAQSAFEIIPNHAQTIKEIFDMYIDQGMGCYSIAKRLNSNLEKFPPFSSSTKRGVASRRIAWHKSYIIKIIQNPAVHGEFTPQTKTMGVRNLTDTVIENYFPAVIPKSRFLLAQANSRKRIDVGGGRKGLTFNNIFTKLVVCGGCNGPVHFLNKGRPPKGAKYLRCYKAEYKNGCDYPAWRYDSFEESFLRFVSEIDLASVTSSERSVTKLKLITQQLLTAEERILRAQAKLDALIALDLSDAAAKRIAKNIETLAIEIDAAENAKETLTSELRLLETASSPASMQDIVNVISKLHADSDLVTQRECRLKLNAEISAVVEKIVIHNERKTFHVWEAFSLLGSHAKKALASSGILTEEQAIRRFEQSDGSQLWDYLNRHFEVKFKDGSTRKVFPEALASSRQGRDVIEDFLAQDLASKLDIEKELSNRKLRKKNRSPATKKP